MPRGSTCPGLPNGCHCNETIKELFVYPSVRKREKWLDAKKVHSIGGLMRVNSLDRPSENRPLVVRKTTRLVGPVKTGQGCAKADRLTDRPSENRPLIVRKPTRLDGPVKTGQGCAETDRLTDRPSENKPLVVRKPTRLEAQ
ncbi:hypothetical protein HELRODRAFT_179512 [Helobdella robusta]|uniref:Uncharacterized protein n=1 Tax=Helobdella robusta TaxID=6412 RepID=T1FET7_HELRO|nr:hypothetical protein HELRODRAFT_179512 [Helobdella robusta]ESN95436.1 hypothetical protein HELRODRAFT_179512 [Helobdella robusta]